MHVDLNDGHLTRSKVKEIVRAQTFKRKDATLIKLINDSDSDEKPAQSPVVPARISFETPRKFGERIMTPMKNFYRNIGQRINLLNKPSKKAHVDYEIINNAICLGMVFTFILIVFLNSTIVIPKENYASNRGLELGFKNESIINTPCYSSYVKVDDLCAPENDSEYKIELKQLQEDFNYLISIYNPIEKEAKMSKTVKHREAFDKIIGNAFFSERLEHHRFTGDVNSNHTGDDIIEIKKDFKVTLPTLNKFYYNVINCIATSKLGNCYYCSFFLALVALTLVSSYHYVFRITPHSEATKLLKIIEREMTEKNMFRNGIVINTIYDWYSSEIRFTKPEFDLRVVPVIEQMLEQSLQSM